MVANYTSRWTTVWTNLIKCIVLKWWPTTKGAGKQCGQILLKVLLWNGGQLHKAVENRVDKSYQKYHYELVANYTNRWKTVWTNLIQNIIMKWWPITQRGGKQCGQILLKVSLWNGGQLHNAVENSVDKSYEKYYYEMVANYTRRWKTVWKNLIKSFIMKRWPITQGGGEMCGQILLKVLLWHKALENSVDKSY